MTRVSFRLAIFVAASGATRAADQCVGFKESNRFALPGDHCGQSIVCVANRSVANAPGVYLVCSAQHASSLMIPRARAGGRILTPTPLSVPTRAHCRSPRPAPPSTTV